MSVPTFSALEAHFEGCIGKINQNLKAQRDKIEQWAAVTKAEEEKLSRISLIQENQGFITEMKQLQDDLMSAIKQMDSLAMSFQENYESLGRTIKRIEETNLALES